MTVTDAVPDVGISRYGAIPMEGRGLPTALPAVHCLDLVRGGRCGLRRYERDCHMESPPCGARVAYPTRNFATLGILVTSDSAAC